MSLQAKQFAQSIAPSAIQACVNTGIFPSVVIAQGILESDSGRSPVARMFNNIFGHIASDSWAGKVGQIVKGGKLWRVYDTILDSIKAHIEVLKHPKYRLHGTTAVKTPFEQAQALQDAGYDAGPDRNKYAQKISAIIRAYNLQAYDQQLFAIERQKNTNGLAYSQQSFLTRNIHNLIG